MGMVEQLYRETKEDNEVKRVREAEGNEAADKLAKQHRDDRDDDAEFGFKVAADLATHNYVGAAITVGKKIKKIFDL